MKPFTQRSAILATLLCVVCSLSRAADDLPAVKPTVVASGLHNPCAVVVQPTNGHIFVADSGAGRIIRITNDGKQENVITGFPKDVYGEGPTYTIGPLGLAFLDSNMLVVGGGGLLDGEELLRVYQVPPLGESIDAAKMKSKYGPIAKGTTSTSGEGNFHGVAAGKAGIFVTCNGDDVKGWIAKAIPKASGQGPLFPFIPTKVATDVDAPGAIALSKDGYLVVSQLGEIDKPGDSLLAFYHPASGNLLMALPTGLHDITGLAYSAKQRLYAVDFAWIDPSQGGLFRLDSTLVDGRQAIKAVRITTLDKPTAVAFGPDGAMYVTVFGTPKPGISEKSGKLLKFVKKS